MFGYCVYRTKYTSIEISVAMHFWKDKIPQVYTMSNTYTYRLLVRRTFKLKSDMSAYAWMLINLNIKMTLPFFSKLCVIISISVLFRYTLLLMYLKNYCSIRPFNRSTLYVRFKMIIQIRIMLTVHFLLSRVYLPFRITWEYPQSIAGFVLIIHFVFCVVFCVLFFSFFYPWRCQFIFQFMILSVPLVSFFPLVQLMPILCITGCIIIRFYHFPWIDL